MMYSLEWLNNLKDELGLILEDGYDKKDKYISTTKINLKCTFDECDEIVTIQFCSLLKNKRAHCKSHVRFFKGNKIKTSLFEKNKNNYNENRNKLYSLIRKLNIELVEDYSLINVKNNTSIHFKCCHNYCNVIGNKQFSSLIKNELFYCDKCHKLLHNQNVNFTLREEDREKYDEYDNILNEFKNKYPQINLNWDGKYISSRTKLHFNCVNSNCNALVCKLFQHVLQNKESMNENVYFACQECKSYISESSCNDSTLLINTPYYDELVEYPKQINYITTHSCIILSWFCGNKCINCNNKHTYVSSPNYRFVQWCTDCPLCLEPNKCNCINDGFICRTCNSYFSDKNNKSLSGNICKICKSKENDDNLEKIFSHMIVNCRSICKNRKGNRQNVDLDIEYLNQMYQEQNDLCYISKIKMSLKVHSDFKISIERVNETNGYVKGNVKFICVEFQNGFNQWTPEKFHEFCDNYYNFQIISETEIENVQKKYDEASVKNTKHFKKRKSPQKPYDDQEKRECLCRTCDTIKSYEHFSDYGINHGTCKNCHKMLNSKKNNPSLRLKISNLISSSKNSIKKRNKSKWRKENPLIHNLTFEELLDIYLEQKGRCAYSTRLLELSGNYMMSLERKNVNIGYTKENCCLICLEFNSTDWSCAKTECDDREGSSGWNKEKLKIIVDNYLNL